MNGEFVRCCCLCALVAATVTTDTDELCAAAATATELFQKILPPPPRVPFNASEGFVPSLVDGARPVVVINSPVLQWPALHASSPLAWTPAAFARAHAAANRTLRAHVSAARITQMHSAVSPLGALPDIGWLRPYEEATYEPAEFMRRASAGEHLIVFAPLKELPLALRGGIGDVVSLSVPWRRVLEVNAWVAGAGQATPAHYDVSGNMYVQVHGKKRFVLFPPTATRYLYLFPKIHPADRSTQVDFDASLEEIQESFFDFDPEEWVEDGVVTVDLVPGEVLYIPPYWFHHVAPVGPIGAEDELSISVSIALDSEQIELRELLRANAPPIARGASLHVRDAALRALLSELLGNRAVRFTRELIRTRWSHAGADVGRPRVAARLAPALRSATQEFERQLRGSVVSVGDATRRELRDFASNVHGALRSRIYEFTPAELDIELGNYIEDCVAHTLNATQVGAFLRRFARLGE